MGMSMKSSKQGYQQILKELRSMASPEGATGMASFGIRPQNEVLGISVPSLRAMAKKIGTDHRLALRLWKSGVHEARVLACLIEDPEEVTEEQMEKWVRGFDSWDLCDLCCGNLFDRTEMAYRKAFEWSLREEEYVRRAGYVMMAALSVHDKAADDDKFLAFLPVVIGGSGDQRNFVKKAVNWALRQIGKRNQHLNRAAIKAGEKIAKMKSSSAKWIASDALRELRSEKVKKRLR
jgi:3-methyladenine DNA glycosylase AlkD